MIIQSYGVPADAAAAIGLKEVSMSRLGRYVAIAGRNGAGKSRLLVSLEELIRSRNQNAEEQAESNIRALSETIQHNPNHPNLEQWRQQVATERARLSAYSRMKCAKGWPVSVARFVPRPQNLEDPNSKPVHQQRGLYEHAKVASVGEYAGVCLSYIQTVQARWWDARHQHFSGTAEERDQRCNEYYALEELINIFLGAELNRSIDGDAILFGRPIATANLSEGQKILLQFVTILHAQQASLDNTIFLMDELENHLHPSACIDLLKRLEAAAPNSQVWLATHSVPLLSYVASVEPNSIWYMDDGRVENAGRRPERVLQGLLGDEESIGRLNAFTGLPAVLATTNYAAECLVPPGVADAVAGDHQVSQIAKLLSGRAGDGVLRVIDYGAGKGRLLEGLAAAFPDEGQLKARIDYIAFDPDATNQGICREVIGQHYGTAEGRYYNNEQGLLAAIDDVSVDVIVMCNVLHEIPPSDWLRLFSGTSLIMKKLKDDGSLLLVEDQRIPVGEHAHKHGFLVLDTAQLKTMFAIKEDDSRQGRFVADDYRDDGRLKAHLITKPLLRHITDETRQRAIEELKARALDEVKRLRGNGPGYANGLLHGFWTQQFANACMFLEE